MRHFGGALIGIFAGLFVMYPIMLVGSSAMAPGLAHSMNVYLNSRSDSGCTNSGAAYMRWII